MQIEDAIKHMKEGKICSFVGSSLAYRMVRCDYSWNDEVHKGWKLQLCQDIVDDHWIMSLIDDVMLSSDWMIV